MTESKIEPAVLESMLNGLSAHRTGIVDPPLRCRMLARIRPGHYDRQIEAGTPAAPGSVLAAHLNRLTSTAERNRLAEALRGVLRPRTEGFSAAVAVHRGRVDAAVEVITEIEAVLQARHPVRARGMARLRILLSDGGGPLYRTGHGSLAAELRGVLAAL
ncbi:MAG: hypothetical protein HYZ38_23650 [Mycobacterium sp.]|nr:hypothetical protein [Mycobacterium sp.]